MLQIISTLAALSTLTLSTLPVHAQSNNLDPRLHRSLWGIAYTTTNSAYYPNCGDTIEEVVRDVELMAQLTTRLRLYGTDCDQAGLVLQAIQQTQANLHVFIGIYIDGNETTYERQRDTAFDVLDEYGVDNILGISVGNEYILQQFTENPAQRDAAEALIIEKIADVREVLASKNYNKDIPVGTADAGSQITTTLSEAADFMMANTHAFFSGVGIEGAADWTAQFLVNDEPRFAVDAGKTLYSAEVGWPTDALPGGSLTLNGSEASIPNLQTFLDTFVCAANDNITAGNEFGYGYFYFELFDAEWKRQFLGAEPFWGLFDADRNLKDITIPDCEAPQLEPVNGGSGGGNGGNGNNGGGNGNGSGNGNGNGNGNGANNLVFPAALTATLVALVGGLTIV